MNYDRFKEAIAGIVFIGWLVVVATAALRQEPNTIFLRCRPSPPLLRETGG